MKHLWDSLQQQVSQMKLRLRASVRRRLALDILAVSTGVRSVVLLDYLPYNPPFLRQFCDLLQHLSQEVIEMVLLRVLDMEGCAYLVHPLYMLDFMEQSLNASCQIMFVSLDEDLPKRVCQAEHEIVVKHLCVVKNQLSSLLLAHSNFNTEEPSRHKEAEDKLPMLEAGSILSNSDILLPTLNGWLLGYPVVYIFKRERASHAGRCLAAGTLHLYQVLVSSILPGIIKPEGNAEMLLDEDELLSFSVPSELSPLASFEPWAKVFFVELSKSVQRACHVWMSVRLEVSSRKMDVVAL
ncbi:hypothetical protein BDL97_08G093300 [Sphagnum fallax]|nr:hypothetical protein BDL97_08G093300 [Sphagnum fallax]